MVFKFLYSFILLITVSLFCFGSLAVEYVSDDEEDVVADDSDEDSVIYIKVQENDKILQKPIYNKNQGEPRQISKDVLEQIPTQVSPPTFLPPASTQHEKLSRARSEAEQTTENKIREKLESIRLRDEQKRLNQVLGPLQEDTSDVSPSQDSYPSITPDSSASYTPSRIYSFHAGVGYIQYWDVGDSVSSSPVYSVGLGIFEGNNLAFDIYGARSKHRLHYPSITQASNLNLFTHFVGAASLKYFLFPGRVKPHIGILASLSYRKYTGEFNWDIHGSTTTTFNMGFLAGLEVFIGSRIVLGLDLRSHFNIYEIQKEFNDPQSSFYDYYNQEKTPEQKTWTNANAYIRLLF